MAKGWVYLTVVLDWYCCKVLAWRLSISMDVDFCIEAVKDAVARWGKPEIFNTEQGSQYTSQAFTQMLLGHGIAISMDGKGCWRDNVFVERLWRSVKYEEVYLKAYDCVTTARQSLGLDFYNRLRPHSTPSARTPETVYFESLPELKLAA
jgi:putative transposase